MQVHVYLWFEKHKNSNFGLEYIEKKLILVLCINLYTVVDNALSTELLSTVSLKYTSLGEVGRVSMHPVF